MRLSHSIVWQSQTSVGTVTDIPVRVNVQLVPNQWLSMYVYEGCHVNSHGLVSDEVMRDLFICLAGMKENTFKPILCTCSHYPTDMLGYPLNDKQCCHRTSG